ncbi:hypothetical protein [Amycolatopsis sp. NPDC051716]|uniref:hypothetical protein n=1 Tax=Amycolatopsis sp. NPDC051716 TaxID=3155804 RepID=UPI003415D5B1
MLGPGGLGDRRQVRGSLDGRLAEGDPDRIADHFRARRRPCTARCALHLTVEHGVITRYHVYEDSLTVLQAFTG